MFDGIKYFDVNKDFSPPIFALVHRVRRLSSKNPIDKQDFERRVTRLRTYPYEKNEGEHIRQCCSFVAEAAAFDQLYKQQFSPHWVPESSGSTPDIYFQEKTRLRPVEVKYLSSPKEEQEALIHQKTYGGFVDRDYHLGLVKKINDCTDSAEAKFTSFHNASSDTNLKTGILFLFFSKGLDASLTDHVAWEEKMLERVKKIAKSKAGTNIGVVVQDLDNVFKLAPVA